MSVPVACVVSNQNGSPKLSTPQTVSVGNTPNTIVQFNLSGLPGYSFPEAANYGISITDKTGVVYPDGHDANDEFDTYKRESSTEVRVNDKNDNSVETDYCYCVTVAGPNNTTLTSDPIIRNR